VAEINPFITTKDGKVYALDASDSAVLWRSQPLSVAGALAFSEEVIIAGAMVDRGRTLVALDPTHGVQRWESQLVSSPINSKPLVDIISNNVIVTSNDGIVYALRLEDGKLRWQFKADSRVRAELIAADNQLLFNSENGTLYALDLDSGISRATFQLAGGQGRTLVAPRVSAHLIVSASGNLVYALDTE